MIMNALDYWWRSSTPNGPLSTIVYTSSTSLHVLSQVNSILSVVAWPHLQTQWIILLTYWTYFFIHCRKMVFRYWNYRQEMMIWPILDLLACATCNAHVALTYPPARKYDLDFLDNARTAAPCGMPKSKSPIDWPHYNTNDINTHNKEKPTNPLLSKFILGFHRIILLYYRHLLRNSFILLPGYATLLWKVKKISMIYCIFMLHSCLFMIIRGVSNVLKSQDVLIFLTL